MKKSKATKRKRGRQLRSTGIVRGHVTQTVRGFNGPGWELSVTGERAWAEKMLKKFIPKIQSVASAL